MTETNPPSADLVLEHLKRIQAGIVQIREDNVEMRREMRAMKDEMVSFKTVMGEFVKTNARLEGDYLHLAARIERIEHRLDMQDQLPPL